MRGRKKRPKFRALSDNFRLWSRISPERIDILQIGKVFYQPEPLPRLAKKLRELWSTNKKVIGAHIDQLKRTFCGRLRFGLWGVLPPQIFIRVTDWPSLASTHHNCDGGERAGLENIMIFSKISKYRKYHDIFDIYPIFSIF